MGRKRKAEVVSSEGAVEAFIDRCFKYGEAVKVQPYFDREYRFPDGSIHIFTTEVLEEMVDSGRVRVTSDHGKFVNLIGII